MSALETQARPGDRLVLRGRRGGDPEKDGEIIEVRGARGGPPYLVRWSDNGHLGFVYPGSDAYVQHLANESPPTAKGPHRKG